MSRRIPVLLLTLSWTAAALADAPKGRWVGDLDSALAAAQTQNKPVFLVFR
jgi:hypothetical protein